MAAPVYASTTDTGEQGVQTANGAVIEGEWVHLAAVGDRFGRTLKIYVNGVEAASRALRGTPAVSSETPFLVGHMQRYDYSYGPLEGAVDEVRLWSVARSAAEIASGMTTRPAAEAAGLTVSLPIDGALPTGAAIRTLNTNGVTGRIDSAGQERRYTFTLSAATLALFDSLSWNGAMRWSLTGPDGVVVETRRFDQSDSADFGGNPALALKAGSYTLTVDGEEDAIGWFNFRLRDLAAATPIALGTRIEGVVAPGSATAAYRFAASAGDGFYFDALLVDGDMRWRLIDPSGRQVSGPSGLSDVDRLTLEATGAYTLLVEGRSWLAGEIKFAFNVQPLVVGTAALTLGTRIEGALATAGETDRYSFTLGAAHRMVFDSLAGVSGLRWSLTGPGGTKVTARSLAQSDSADIGGSTVLDLVAGTWTLTIDGDRDIVGDYAFRLLDLAQAIALVPDAPTAGRLDQSGREIDAYRFDMTAGARFQLDMLAAGSADARWRLIDPLGQLVFGPAGLADTEILTAALTGSYTLLVEGRVSNTAASDYRFTLVIPPQPAANGATTQTFDGTGLPYVTNTNGAWDPVVSTGGATGNFLRLSSRNRPSSLGTATFNAVGSGAQDAIQVDWDFRINGTSDGMGFALLPATLYGVAGAGAFIAEEPNLPGVLGIGFDIFSNGETSANHVSLHWNGAKLLEVADPGVTLAGNQFIHARVLVRRTDGGALVTLELTEPGGAAKTPIKDVFVGGLDVLGDSRVQLSGRAGGTAADQDIDNVAVALTPRAVTPPVIALDTLVTGDVARAGGVYRHRIVIGQPTALVFDALTNNSNLRWSIEGPTATGGQRVFTNSDAANYGDNPVLTLAPGSYDVVLSATSGQTGSYAFRLASLAGATALTLDGVQELTLDPGNRTQLFSFDAAAGQALFFDRIAGSGDPVWRLIDPAGQMVFGPASDDVDAPVLAIGGRYTLMVEGRIGTTAPQTVSFRVGRIVDGDAAMTVGAIVRGTISGAGERDRLRFTLAQPTRLLFDSLVNNSALSWTLTGPAGTIDARRFDNSDSYNRNDAAAFFAAAGDYVLTVDASGDQIGDYAFRLLDVAAATPMQLGAVVEGVLDPAAGSALYSFAGTAGDRLFFDALSFTGSAGARWRLVDPDGRQALPVTYNRTDMGPVTLTKTGTYVLQYEGDPGTTGTLAYSFRATKIVDLVQPLTLGTTATGTLDQPLQSALLTFTLAAPTRVLIDPIGTDGALQWTLSGPRGDETTRRFDQSDSYGLQTSPVLDLPAGSYTLKVSSTATASSPFAIRVHDLAAAAAIAPGVPIAGTLSPGSETELYRFEATAGQRFFFDSRALSSGSAAWRLIGPDGRQVFRTGFADVDTIALSVAGTYTLMLEGQFGNQTSVSPFVFNVIENTPSAPVAINQLELVPGPDLVPVSAAVTAAGAIVSGGRVTLSWTTRNDGDRATGAAWSDRIIVRNLDSGAIIANLVDVDRGGALQPGGTRARQIEVQLPADNNGAGRLSFSIALDVGNDVAEQNRGGNAETNNLATVEIVSGLAPFIDMQVIDLAVVTPAGWTAGAPVTLNWKTRNAGIVATTGGWSERIYARNLITGEQIALVEVAVTEALAGRRGSCTQLHHRLAGRAGRHRRFRVRRHHRHPRRGQGSE